MMMRKFLWGILLVIVAGALILDFTTSIDLKNLFDIDVLFDGWWTLIIIVPCFVGLIFSKEKIYNLIGVIIGTGLLLYCQDIISFKHFYVIIMPAIIVVVGFKLIINSIFLDKANRIISNMKRMGIYPQTCRGILLDCSMNFEEEIFQNAEISGIFANVACDLHNSIIENNRAIKALALFGNVNIYVPNNVNVVIRSSSIFGGVTNGVSPKPDGITIYISCTCIFGGVKIESPNTEFDGPWVL